MRKIFVCLVCWMIFHSCCALAEDDAGMIAYRQKDYASAMAEWKTAAEQGSARAKASIGVLYLWRGSPDWVAAGQAGLIIMMMYASHAMRPGFKFAGFSVPLLALGDSVYRLEITEGKVDGDNVSFVVVNKEPKRETTSTYKGKVAGDKIEFTLEVKSGQEGSAPAEYEITAKRVGS